MLHPLYKKLQLLYIASMMLIITIIIGIVAMNHVKSERLNNSTYVQRLATLLIYQLEYEATNQSALIQTYEEEYQMFCLLKDQNNSIIYQSEQTFASDENTLLEQFNNQVSKRAATDMDAPVTTVQGGLVEISGTVNDAYWAIPADIISKDHQGYKVILMFQQKKVMDLLILQLPLYGLLWIASLLGVSFLSHALLKKALRPTELVLKSQKEFVASASHELKSPLAVIVANIEVLKNSDKQNTQIQKAMSIVDFECMRMSKLINDMLLLAASDAKTWTPHVSEVDIDTLLVTLYEAYEPMCIKKDISLQLDLSKESYPVLHTDKERCMQILHVFMENALAHTKHTTLIQIQTTIKANTITISIIDHGDGIKDEQKALIFNRFYCGDASHSKKSHFGLGLSIAKELATMLHGEIGCRDTLGGGATFYITLPLT